MNADESVNVNDPATLAIQNVNEQLLCSPVKR